MAGSNNFPDHRDRFFGRDRDVEYLLGRAKNAGITAVTGRPKMGKTWLLEEMARRLCSDGQYLVGYHESRGQSADTLLRAVSDLYTRWLADAGMCSQAQTMWGRHKDKFITGVGQAVGRVFEGVGKLVHPAFDTVGGIVHSAFDGLTFANQDLKTGGLQLKPLDYDQAHELIRILAAVSEKPLVLILDAWEHSPSLEFEHRTLSMFLSHLTEWPHVHVFLGVRQPHLRDQQPADRANNFVEDLQKCSVAAKIYDLLPMQLDDLVVRDRLLAYLRGEIPVAGQVRGDRLLQIVDGFPGVIDQWVTENLIRPISDERRLESLAADAQAYRYREFDWLFPSLSSSERTLAIRLAVLPRMDAESWPKLQDIVCRGLAPADCDELTIKGVLQNAVPPAYGHDTRHTTARDWFTTNSRFSSLAKRETEAIVLQLANRCQHISEEDGPFVGCLRDLRDLASRLQLSAAVCAFCDAATSLFGDFKGGLNWITFERGRIQILQQRLGGYSLLAAALVNRGASKGAAGDTPGELASRR